MATGRRTCTAKVLRVSLPPVINEYCLTPPQTNKHTSFSWPVEHLFVFVRLRVRVCVAKRAHREAQHSGQVNKRQKSSGSPRTHEESCWSRSDGARWSPSVQTERGASLKHRQCRAGRRCLKVAAQRKRGTFTGSLSVDTAGEESEGAAVQHARKLGPSNIMIFITAIRNSAILPMTIFGFALLTTECSALLPVASPLLVHAHRRGWRKQISAKNVCLIQLKFMKVV